VKKHAKNLYRVVDWLAAGAALYFIWSHELDTIIAVGVVWGMANALLAPICPRAASRTRYEDSRPYRRD
jgi:hypothetical protein